MTLQTHELHHPVDKPDDTGPCIMLSQPWLALSAPAPGFQGSYLLESPSTHPTNDASPILFCVGNVDKQSFLEIAGVADCTQEENTILLRNWYHYVIADCYLAANPALRTRRGGPLLAEAQLHHLMQEDLESVLARLVRPFASCVLFFADDFGGLRRSTRILARWVLFSMQDSIPCPPGLLVVHHSDSADTRLFCRQMDAALLALLRQTSPERPYAIAEVSNLRKQCFNSIEVISRDAVLETISESFDGAQTLHMRSVEQGVAFRLLIAHLCEHPSLGFDLLEALNSKEPMPLCSGFYIKRFLKTAAETMTDPIPFLASCLAAESTSCLLCSKWEKKYVSYRTDRSSGLISPGEVFQPIKYFVNGTSRY